MAKVAKGKKEKLSDNTYLNFFHSLIFYFIIFFYIQLKCHIRRKWR